MLPTNLPTDNLYKFVTILGIVIFVASIYALVGLNDRAVAQGQVFMLEYQKHEPTSKRAGEIREEVEKLKARDQSNTTCMLGFAAFGVLVCIAGLIVWAVKHQRFQDRLVRLEVDEAERAAAESGAAYRTCPPNLKI